MFQAGLSWGERVVYWVVILALLVAFLLYRRASLPVAIFVKGEPIAWVGNYRLANRAIELAREHLRKRYGPNTDFAETIDTGNMSLPSGEKLLSPLEAAELLLSKVSPAQRAWLIKVYGQIAVALRSKDEAEQALELVKAHFTPVNECLVKPPCVKGEV
ncbi:MAG: hypothetical protein ACUVSC_09725, partial [Candidatus Fervidibacter sp.]|uniref:hypothetical protein n=1 Tax=Candidatus Fervidibacter sp. TaxID=3100871 RepID=UPI00404AFC63